MTVLLIFLVCVFGQANAKFLGDSMMNRPIVICSLTGLVMGNFEMGLKIGGSLELAWLGLIYYGVSMPAEVVTGSAVGTYYAISTGNGFDVAVAIALPAGMLASYVSTLYNGVGSAIVGITDKYAENGEIEKINRVHILYGTLKCIVMSLVVVIFIVAGNDVIQNLINAIPDRLMTGLGVASGILPAVGFAMLLNIMWDKRYLPLFFAGFVLTSYFSIDSIALSVIVLCLALFKMFNTKDSANSNNDGGVEIDV